MTDLYGIINLWNVQISAVYGGKKTSCKVYTYNQLIYTDFTGYKTTPIKTKKGRTAQLKPEKHGSTVFYKSSNTKIATVSSSGVVTPKTTGTVSIQWILRDQITSAALNECARYKFDISAQYGCTYRNIIAKAHSKNIKVALWLFTDSSIADCYKNWGADYLTCERMM